MLFLETLTIAVGPTGSGKSLFEMILMEHFLLNDTRVIVTTLAIDLPRLAEYMQETHGDKAPALIGSRVIRIFAEDLARFWRVRGIRYDGDYGYEPERRGVFGGADWQSPTPGVIYLLDELQVKFKAREFMKNSGEFLDYQPQARKLGDTIIGVSPASSLLDKGFRDLANSCIVLTNMYKVKVKGFVAPRKIVARIYANCPPAHGEVHTDEHSFTIDAAGLASCYRTQEGIGVRGIGADIGKVVRGVPWWTIFPLGLAIGLLAYFALSSGLHGSMRWGFKKLSVATGAVSTNAASVFAAVSPGHTLPPAASAALMASTPALKPKSEPPPPVKAVARGFAILNRTLYIDTRFGLVTATAWTNRGDAILANGVEWSLPAQGPTVIVNQIGHK